MNAPATNGTSATTGTKGAEDTTGSRAARNLRWLLANLVDEVPGVQSVAVVSSDGLLLLSSDPEAVTGDPPAEDATENAAGHPAGDAPGHARDEAERPQGPRGAAADLATIVSGVGSLTVGAARLLDTGGVKQTMVSMANGSLFVMSVSDGSLLGVHAAPDCDMSVVAYHMALFVGRAGHVLTPELRTELRKSMELESKK